MSSSPWYSRETEAQTGGVTYRRLPNRLMAELGIEPMSPSPLVHPLGHTDSPFVALRLFLCHSAPQRTRLVGGCDRGRKSPSQERRGRGFRVKRKRLARHVGGVTGSLFHWPHVSSCHAPWRKVRQLHSWPGWSAFSSFWFLAAVVGISATPMQNVSTNIQSNAWSVSPAASAGRRGSTLGNTLSHTSKRTENPFNELGDLHRTVCCFLLPAPTHGLSGQKGQLCSSNVTSCIAQDRNIHPVTNRNLF